MNREVNERIRRLRKKSKITQEEMGEKLNMKRSTYAHIESYGNFKVEQLRIIAQIFNLTLDELIDGENYFIRSSIEREAPPQPVLQNSPFSFQNNESDIYNILTEFEKKYIRKIRYLSKESKDKAYEFVCALEESEKSKI